MTLQIKDPQDFIKRLKTLIDAHILLRESGIDIEDNVFGAATISFLDQFDTPATIRTSSVPLPPVLNTKVENRHPAAWIARDKTTGGTLAGTVATYSIDVEALLKEKIIPVHRYQYEIVPLYTND